EPHDLELGIAQTAALDRADVVVFEHDFQPAVDEAIANVATGVEVDAAEVVDLRADASDPGEHDPHFWLDPLLMADLGDAVAEALAEADPAGAADYAAKAADIRADLEGVDAAYTRALASCERTTMVVTHEAFGYLERYGLHFEGIVGLTPDAEPTPAAIARLQELIAEEGITTVFSERLASTAMADALAADTDVTTAVLDPIEGPAEGEAGSDYVALMEQNLAALRKAGAC
ncbi:metal ABC transporter substrate-binding protein, partial [Nocardioides sp.]|uniref:metal ABC transporter substrate-binding protein n=1 Tax=Nocardioides sp. TaxID=35761 RepID=UPI00286E7E98